MRIKNKTILYQNNITCLKIKQKPYKFILKANKSKEHKNVKRWFLWGLFREEYYKKTNKSFGYIKTKTQK